MADWSELPPELIGEILTYLNSPIDILRFRSVCSTWRQSTPSATQSNGHQPPFSLPSLFKRSIYLLSPPETALFESPENPNSWVIKIEEQNPNFVNLVFPLSWTQITPLPNNFPRIMDLSNIRIRELGREYFLRYTGNVSFRGDFHNMIMEKVAFVSGKNGDDFFILTIHVSGGLALFSNVDNQWRIISDHVDLPYDDVIAFNGEFYAVDSLARTVLVDFDTVNNSVNVVANSLCGGDQKRLAEMGGELMLVDVYMSFPPWDADHNMEDLDAYVMSSRSVWFKVYRLDREGKKWVEVKDLGNNILFVGRTSAFSASALEFSSCKGNCIYFSFPESFHPYYFNEEDEALKFHCGGVFNLEDDSISYSKLFWPPPPWITSTSLEANTCV